MNKYFDLDSREKLLEIINDLRSFPMQKYSHGYEKYKNKTIGEAADLGAEEFLSGLGMKNAAIKLMSVVLAANRKYETHVKPRIDDLYKNHPNLTFRSLNDLLQKNDFLQFGKIWGHRDEKKYETLKSLVRVILVLQSNSGLSDMDVMRGWAKLASLENKSTDVLGRLPNIGVATFQHLRMSYGIDTVKPDLRVKQVLADKFEAHQISKANSDIQVIEAIEELSKIVCIKTILIDQIFVKYGSGYLQSRKLHGDSDCRS